MLFVRCGSVAPFPAIVFESLPNLKLFVTTGMRNAAVDVSAANKNGITVCGTSGSGMSTPEQTWALLASMRSEHSARRSDDARWGMAN